MSEIDHTSDIPYGYCQCGCGNPTTLATRTMRGLRVGDHNRYLRGHGRVSQRAKPRPRTKQPVVLRFWSKVALTANPDKCWEWVGDYGHQYGAFKHNGKNYRAHRFAWELTHGTIPDGLYVCHHCDNKKCVNPNHLFLGTNDANMADLVEKRRRGQLPEADRTSVQKLSSEQVRSMRQLYESGGIKQVELAEMFGVSKSHVNKIVKRHSRVFVSG